MTPFKIGRQVVVKIDGFYKLGEVVKVKEAGSIRWENPKGVWHEADVPLTYKVGLTWEYGERHERHVLIDHDTALGYLQRFKRLYEAEPFPRNTLWVLWRMERDDEPPEVEKHINIKQKAQEWVERNRHEHKQQSP